MRVLLSVLFFFFICTAAYSQFIPEPKLISPLKYNIHNSSIKTRDKFSGTKYFNFISYVDIEYGVMFVVHPPLAYANGFSNAPKEPYMHTLSVTGNINITKNILFGWVQFGAGYIPDDEAGILLAGGIRCNIPFAKKHFISLGAGAAYLNAKSFPSTYLVFDAKYSIIMSKNFGLTTGLRAMPRISKDDDNTNLKHRNFYLMPQLGIHVFF
ncbi:MAG: hypothetical protein EHM58_15955 [Ignavibacteriae bacterium]|nr:MAG: hypothetical protein EHM58_15955 [Ignavibacteriota bacterium]